MTLPNWTPPLTKLRVYEAFYLLNRSFEATIHAIDQLQRLEFFQDADLPVLKSRLEALRSETNETLMSDMQEYEQDESFRFGEIVREREKENFDPNELFFRAEEHKEKLREQLRKLQDALDRQGPDRRVSKRKKRKRRATKSKMAKGRLTKQTE